MPDPQFVDQMNVSITDHLAEFVKARVGSGRFNNASEVVREALRRMEQDDERALRLAALTVEDVVTNLTAIQTETIRKRVLEGIGQIARGESIEVEGKAGLVQLTGGKVSDLLPQSAGMCRDTARFPRRARPKGFARAGMIANRTAAPSLLSCSLDTIASRLETARRFLGAGAASPHPLWRRRKTAR
jgi:antitoxin ParD1/3/4